MPQRIDAPGERAPMPPHLGPSPEPLRDAPAVAELFRSIFARDLAALVPAARFDPIEPASGPIFRLGPNFRLLESESGPDLVELYGVSHRLGHRDGGRLDPRDRRMVRAIGSVLGLRYHHLFEITHSV